MGFRKSIRKTEISHSRHYDLSSCWEREGGINLNNLDMINAPKELIFCLLSSRAERKSRKQIICETFSIFSPLHIIDFQKKLAKNLESSKLRGNCVCVQWEFLVFPLELLWKLIVLYILWMDTALANGNCNTY